jgi:hypothetical protein
MWLRQTDGKMRRDGVRAALLQRNQAIDERANLHAAPGLSRSATLRGVDAKTLSQQREEARMVESKQPRRPIKRLFKSGFEIPVHGDSRRVAESRA